MKKKIVAIICARLGSKGLKKKNLKNFNGKPLVYWTINFAIKSRIFYKVLVSTDSSKIIKIARKLGATVMFKRPKILSGDKISEIKVWKHLLKIYYKKYKEKPSTVVSLSPTSPLRKKVDIVNAINEFNKGFFDIVITGSRSNRSPYYNVVEKKNRYFKTVVEKNLVSRQETPITYDVNTIAYVTSYKNIFKIKNIFKNKVGLIETPKSRSVDIDDRTDFKFAEYLSRNEI